MKRLSCLLVAVVLTLSVVSPALAEAEISGGAYVGFFDKYLWRGMNLSGSKPVAQGGVDLSVGGFTMSYWSNFQLSNAEGYKSGELNETDIILDYSFDLNDLVSISAGNILYAIEGADDTNELYLGVALNMLLNPSLTVYYDWDEFSGSVFAVAAIGHEMALADKLALSLGASASYYRADSDLTGTGSSENFLHNAEISASVTYALTERLAISPSILYSIPISNDAEDIFDLDDEILGGINLAYSF